ncbi:MAG: glutamate-1-semialdehyde 2,1-aminomutase [Candidatus Riflebacteria bacterium]|nr:glutamate-1-semialdehyde 2,1-aminomutase [Candidatus Riflebacteria bacterium]
MTTNQSCFEEAKAFFPGGVNSPVRAFKAVGGTPPFIANGKGACLLDVEGRSFIDYVGSWGPLILGHADPAIIQAVTEAIAGGMTFGAPTPGETELAKLIQQAFPSMEKMRLVSSGTEATMAAIRLARGYTKRTLLVKCDGCYHGHADSLLVSAGSGVATLGIPGCPGVVPGTASSTLTVPFNDIKALEAVFAAHGKDIAAFIVEPVCGNMGVVTPNPGYLAAVRELTARENALLIFDEVMTGFRSCFGGVQTGCGVKPDLTCLGKIVGGGLPLAVYGGKREIMNLIAPDGPVYQAGTLSGNPVAVAAGRATLTRLRDEKDLYKKLIASTNLLADGLLKLAKNHHIPVIVNRFGSMFTLFFTSEPVTSYADAKKADTARFVKWFQEMLGRGVYLPPSQFEAAFVSVCHGEPEIDTTLNAAHGAFSAL